MDPNFLVQLEIRDAEALPEGTWQLRVLPEVQSGVTFLAGRTHSHRSRRGRCSFHERITVGCPSLPQRVILQLLKEKGDTQAMPAGEIIFSGTTYITNDRLGYSPKPHEVRLTRVQGASDHGIDNNVVEVVILQHLDLEVAMGVDLADAGNTLTYERLARYESLREQDDRRAERKLQLFDKLKQLHNRTRETLLKFVNEGDESRQFDRPPAPMQNMPPPAPTLKEAKSNDYKRRFKYSYSSFHKAVAPSDTPVGSVKKEKQRKRFFDEDTRKASLPKGGHNDKHATQDMSDSEEVGHFWYLFSSEFASEDNRIDEVEINEDKALRQRRWAELVDEGNRLRAWKHWDAMHSSRRELFPLFSTSHKEIRRHFGRALALLQTYNRAFIFISIVACIPAGLMMYTSFTLTSDPENVENLSRLNRLSVVAFGVGKGRVPAFYRWLQFTLVAILIFGVYMLRIYGDVANELADKASVSTSDFSLMVCNLPRQTRKSVVEKTNKASKRVVGDTGHDDEDEPTTDVESLSLSSGNRTDSTVSLRDNDEDDGDDDTTLLSASALYRHFCKFGDVVHCCITYDIGSFLRKTEEREHVKDELHFLQLSCILTARQIDAGNAKFTRQLLQQNVQDNNPLIRRVMREQPRLYRRLQRLKRDRGKAFRRLKKLNQELQLLDRGVSYAYSNTPIAFVIFNTAQDRDSCVNALLSGEVGASDLVATTKSFGDRLSKGTTTEGRNMQNSKACPTCGDGDEFRAQTEGATLRGSVDEETGRITVHRSCWCKQLRIFEPPGADDIQYRNLQYSTHERQLQSLRLWMWTTALLLLSFLVNGSINYTRFSILEDCARFFLPGVICANSITILLTYVATLSIVAINQMLVYEIRYFSQFELFATKSKSLGSLIARLSIATFVNSTIMILVVYWDPNQWQEPGHIVIQVTLNQALNIGFPILDILKASSKSLPCIGARDKVLTEERMRALARPPPFEYAKQFSLILKIYATLVFFAPLVPLGAPIALVALVACFLTHRLLLLRFVRVDDLNQLSGRAAISGAAALNPIVTLSVLAALLYDGAMEEDVSSNAPGRAFAASFRASFRHDSSFALLAVLLVFWLGLLRRVRERVLEAVLAWVGVPEDAAVLEGGTFLEEQRRRGWAYYSAPTPSCMLRHNFLQKQTELYNSCVDASLIIDADQSGHMDARELRSAMDKLKMSINAKDAERIIRVLDVDGNGSISTRELRHFAEDCGFLDTDGNVLFVPLAAFFRDLLGEPQKLVELERMLLETELSLAECSSSLARGSSLSSDEENQDLTADEKSSELLRSSKRISLHNTDWFSTLKRRRRERLRIEGRRITDEAKLRRRLQEKDALRVAVAVSSRSKQATKALEDLSDALGDMEGQNLSCSRKRLLARSQEHRTQRGFRQEDLEELYQKLQHEWNLHSTNEGFKGQRPMSLFGKQLDPSSRVAKVLRGETPESRRSDLTPPATQRHEKDTSPAASGSKTRKRLRRLKRQKLPRVGDDLSASAPQERMRSPMYARLTQSLRSTATFPADFDDVPSRDTHTRSLELDHEQSKAVNRRLQTSFLRPSAASSLRIPGLRVRTALRKAARKRIMPEEVPRGFQAKRLDASFPLPPISRTYQITLQLEEEKRKKLNYRFGRKGTWSCMSSQPEIVDVLTPQPIACDAVGEELPLRFRVGPVIGVQVSFSVVVLLSHNESEQTDALLFEVFIIDTGDVVAQMT